MKTKPDKKELILDAAIRLFVSKGFDKVSTSEISKTAGVATGTMFHHFSTREQIINEAYQKTKLSFIACTQLPDEPQAVKEELKLMWDNLIRWSLEHRAYFYYMQQFKHSAYYRNDLIKEEESWKAVLSWWNMAIARGTVKSVGVDFLLTVFTGLLYSTVEFLMDSGEEITPCLETSFLLCWDMLKKN